jgi:hypothetical protein
VGSGRNEDAARFGGGEAEYAREMGQRLARVCKIDCFPLLPSFGPTPPFYLSPPPIFMRCAYAYGFPFDWLFSIVPWVAG